MTETEFFTHLQQLSLTQLSLFQAQLNLKILQKKEATKAPSRMLGPRENIATMADNLGLDLSSMMREISRR